MKREELEALGLEKDVIDKVLSIHNSEIQAEKAKTTTANDELKAATDKLKTTEEALKKFEGANVDDLNAQIKKLTEDLKQKDIDHKNQIADRDFNDLLDKTITEKKGKNVKAIKALLDLDALKSSNNQKDDIEKAIDKLNQADDSKFLFGEPDPQAVGSGNPIGNIQNTNKSDDDAFVRSIMGLPPLKQ